MPGGVMFWSENLGCFVSKDILSTERELFCGGAENREKAKGKTTEEAENGLFEDIGRYFHISSSAEQMEAEDEAGGLERLTGSQEGIQAEGHTRVALYEKDVRKVFER